MNKIRALTLDETKLKEEKILAYLSNLTNGALNYYQSSTKVMILDGSIRDYIKQLQQENQTAKQTINELSNKIAKLVEDKKQLKEQRKKLVKICWKNDLEITSEENELLEDLYDLVRGDSNE